MPLQTTLENLQQKLTQMGVAGHAVGLENHRQMLHDANKRTRDAHRLQMKSLGESQEDREDDEMGDLVITGDIEFGSSSGGKTTPSENPSVPPPANPIMEDNKYEFLKELIKLAGVASLGAALAIGSAKLLGEGGEPKPPVVESDPDDYTSTIRPMR
jgi:hypothetical protein